MNPIHYLLYSNGVIRRFSTHNLLGLPSDSGELGKDEEEEDSNRVMSTNNEDDGQENDQPDEAEHL